VHKLFDSAEGKAR